MRIVVICHGVKKWNTFAPFQYLIVCSSKKTICQTVPEIQNETLLNNVIKLPIVTIFRIRKKVPDLKTNLCKSDGIHPKIATNSKTKNSYLGNGSSWRIDI